jgi:hypothetical protein
MDIIAKISLTLNRISINMIKDCLENKGLRSEGYGLLRRNFNLKPHLR